MIMQPLAVRRACRARSFGLVLGATSMLCATGQCFAQESRADGAARPVPPASVGQVPVVPVLARRAPPAPFDHSRWVVTLTAEGAGDAPPAAPLEDALAFVDGKMTSHVGASQGFEPSGLESGPTWARAEARGPNGRGKREY